MTLKCKVNAFLKKNKEEVFGFLAEKRFSFELENVEKDIISLYENLEDFYLNISIYISDNSSTSLKDKPDLMTLSQRVIQDFYHKGFYR